jgi:hypothetical protein
MGKTPQSNLTISPLASLVAVQYIFRDLFCTIGVSMNLKNIFAGLFLLTLPVSGFAVEPQQIVCRITSGQSVIAKLKQAVPAGDYNATFTMGAVEGQVITASILASSVEFAEDHRHEGAFVTEVCAERSDTKICSDQSLKIAVSKASPVSVVCHVDGIY